MTFLASPALALILAVLAAPAAAQTVRIDTAGGLADAPHLPARIAVYDVAAIDTLDALGVKAAGVPSPMHLPRLDGAVADAARIGTLFEPDLEAVNALAPDLIIVGGRSAAAADALRPFGPVIDMSIWGEDLTDVAIARIRAYGAIFDKGPQADALIADLRARIAAAHNAAEGQGTALIVLANGPKISVFGPKSRFGWVHGAVGLAPAAEELDDAAHGRAVSFEFLLEVNPDWLIVIDRGAATGAAGAGARATLSNEVVARTKAWQAGHVIYLDPSEVYISGGGHGALARVIADVTAALTAAR